MKTKRSSVRSTAAALAGGLGLLAGCATTGETPRAAPTRATGANQAAEPASGAAAVSTRSFYADWYDATAIVLPPPPAEPAARR